MFFRLFVPIIVCAAFGCESLSTTHQASEVIPSGPPLLALTSLTNSENRHSLTLSKPMVFSTFPDDGISQKKNPIDPFPTVYFSFDSWEITSDVQSRLNATADWMNRFPVYGLTIEGHTDIRGTESYNMILGVRRAKAVKEYLANLGIPRKRIDVVSYGKTLVLCDEEDEHNCHQYNRRADLLLE